MIYGRKTLKKDARFEGRGLHSGIPVAVHVRPGSSGIRFLLGNQLWEARPDQVSDTTRCTRLGEIGTIEHLMSALAACEVTDADVEISEPELPALDGSAGPYFRELEACGLEDLGQSELPDIFSRVFVQDGDAKIGISAGTGHWRYEFNTGERWPGSQVYESNEIVRAFVEDLADARTFAFQEELPLVQAAGLGQGLDSESALILGESGYLNAERFDDEPVRHKLVDLIGDLYLAGIPVRLLNVSAVRSGHTLAVRAAAALREQISQVPVKN